MGKDRLRPLGMAEAKSTSGPRLTPCNNCDLEPSICDKQRLIATESAPDTLVLCGLGRGLVRRLEKPLKLDRVKIRVNNGQLRTDREILKAAEASV